MNVILATDGSDYSHAAMRMLERILSEQSPEVTVLTVCERASLFDYVVDGEESHDLNSATASLEEEAERLLSEEADSMRSDTGWTVHTSIRQGHVANEIVKAAEELVADLVVIGSHGRKGLRRFLLGSVSQKVVKYSPCSVLVGRLAGDERPSRSVTNTEIEDHLRVLLAFDGSPPAEAAVDLLTSLAHRCVEITVVTVLTVVTTLCRQDIIERLSTTWQEYKRSSQEKLTNAAARLREVTPHVTTKLLDGGSDASDEILREADRTDADLVVLGHTGKSSVDRFLLGSVSHRVIHHAACSVLVVRK